MAETTEPIATEQLTIDAHSQRFYQGVAAGSKVREAHDPLADQIDHETRVRLYWFYVGALAARQYRCSEEEDFEPFLLGAKMREPGARVA